MLLRKSWSKSIGVVCAIVAGLACGCSSAQRQQPVAARSYAFWPQPPAEPRIQFLRAFTRTSDVSLAKQSGFDKLVFGAETDQAVDINKPYGVAMRDGKIYVCDIRNVDVTVLDLNKREARLIGVSGLNRLQNPVDIAVAEDGTVYVADKPRGISVFDSSERFVRLFSHDKFQPIGVAVAGDHLYVCNMGTQVVEVLDRRTGEQVATIGSVGDGDGQFRLPLGIDVDAQGNIHVVDIMRCRLQKFSPDGKLLAGIGAMTDTAGNFVRPKHIAVDRDGLVYVVDSAFQNVQVFDSDYRLLTSFGAAGNYPGAMDLPAGICVVDDGMDLFGAELHPYFKGQRLILVTNQFGPNKVAVYALGRLNEGRTPNDLAAALAPMTPAAPASELTKSISEMGTQPLSNAEPPSTSPQRPPDQE